MYYYDGKDNTTWSRNTTPRICTSAGSRDRPVWRSICASSLLLVRNAVVISQDMLESSFNPVHRKVASSTFQEGASTGALPALDLAHAEGRVQVVPCFHH